MKLNERTSSPIAIMQRERSLSGHSTEFRKTVWDLKTSAANQADCHTTLQVPVLVGVFFGVFFFKLKIQGENLVLRQNDCN